MLAYNKKLVKGLRWFEDKRVLILGFGREGQDSLHFLRALFPRKTIGVADREVKVKKKELGKKNIRWHLGKKYLKAIERYDVIIKSPGIPPKLIEPRVNIKGGQIVTSQTEIFFDNYSGKVIGITGTKGKSTTTSMIYHILKRAGLPVHLVGNIGKPVLSTLLKAKTDDIFVYELSSHQLYGMRKSPHIAVFLDIYPEHLDYYRNFAEYARAKANICLWQKKGDCLIFNKGDMAIRRFASKSKAKKISIKGKYYELDRAAARTVGKIFGIPDHSIEKSLKNFQYLPHRLEPVGTFRSVTFYNDSLATIPQATIAALDLLGSRVETLIAGGFDRGIDFKILAERIWRSNVKTLILFSPSGRRILKEMIVSKKANNSIASFLVSDMAEAVRLSFARTRKGKICLLSPASPSFGLFRDYQDRGNAYKEGIKRFSRKKVRKM